MAVDPFNSIQVWFQDSFGLGSHHLDDPHHDQDSSDDHQADGTVRSAQDQLSTRRTGNED
jgi:hypothetical protein